MPLGWRNIDAEGGTPSGLPSRVASYQAVCGWKSHTPNNNRKGGDMEAGVGCVGLVVTGSRVFGPAREDSDIDIVLEPDGAADLEQWLNGHGIKVLFSEAQEEFEYQGFYFSVGGMAFSIIVAGTSDEESMGAWEYATNKMKSLPPIIDREVRIQTFREFRQEFVSRRLGSLWKSD